MLVCDVEWQCVIMYDSVSKLCKCREGCVYLCVCLYIGVVCVVASKGNRVSEFACVGTCIDDR